MIYMLDTNIIVYLMRNRPEIVARKIASLPRHDKLCMSFITYSELLKGVYGSEYAEKSRQKLTRLAQHIDVLLPRESISEHYARLGAHLKQHSIPIGNNDLWIAAHALSLGAVLVSNQIHVFQHISGLIIEDWTQAA